MTYKNYSFQVYPAFKDLEEDSEEVGEVNELQDNKDLQNHEFDYKYFRRDHGQE